MAPRLARAVRALSLTATTTALEGDPPEPECRGCPGERLDLVQPDQRRAEHLVGVCGRCGAWYLLALAGEGTAEGGILLDLPHPSLMRAAYLVRELIERG